MYKTAAKNQYRRDVKKGLREARKRSQSGRRKKAERSRRRKKAELKTLREFFRARAHGQKIEGQSTRPEGEQTATQSKSELPSKRKNPINEKLAAIAHPTKKKRGPRKRIKLTRSEYAARQKKGSPFH